MKRKSLGGDSGFNEPSTKELILMTQPLHLSSARILIVLTINKIEQSNQILDFRDPKTLHDESKARR